VSEEEKSGLNRRGFLGVLGAIGITPQVVKTMVETSVPEPTLGSVKGVIGSGSIQSLNSFTKTVHDLNSMKDKLLWFKRVNTELSMDWWALREKLETIVRLKNPNLYKDSTVPNIEDSPFKSFARHHSKYLLQIQCDKNMLKFRECICEECAKWLNDALDKVVISNLNNSISNATTLISLFEKEYGHDLFKKYAMEQPNLKMIYDMTDSIPHDWMPEEDEKDSGMSVE